MPARSRPLSPHLSIYRFTLTMTMSIVHRATGVAMYFGTLLIVLWLGAAALGEGPFGVVNALYGFWLVQVILFGATWALFYHLMSGLRFLVWDTGQLTGNPAREWMAWIALVLSVVLTLGAWALFVWFK